MKAVGIILIVIGVIWGLVALNMDTTVETGGQRIGSGLYSVDVPKTRVHNLGLIEERRNHLTLASVTVLVGVVLFGFGSISRALPAGEMKPCPHCAEFIRREARICRFCQRDVSQTAATALTQPQKLSATEDASVANAARFLDSLGYQVARDGARFVITHPDLGGTSYVYSADDLNQWAKSAASRRGLEFDER